MSDSEDHCEHYDAQVAVRIVELEEDNDCSWCGADTRFGLLKSERHGLTLCEECRELIQILASESNG